MSGEKDVLVIGAGIVGTCCALYLQREGFAVTLMDKTGPAAGATAGNAGNLGFASVVPHSLPGVIRKVPGMLFDRLGPLKLRWGHLPRALPWFLRFIAASRPGNVEAIADARHSLLSRLHEGYQPLLEDADATHLIEASGLLMTWESEAAFNGARYGIELRRRRGITMEILTGNEARNIEPALTEAVTHALYVPRLAHVLDPKKLTETFVRHFQARGGRFLRAEARGFEIGPDGPTRVLTDQGPVAFGQVVLAAGAWSAPLAAELGTHVPLQAERGYHAMFPNPGLQLRTALMSADRYVAVTGMEPGVRVTGVAEFAPVDAPPNDAYVEMIVRQAKGLLPRLDTTIGSRWLGARPSCPDSKPVLGRSPRHANAWFAFGHDHIGLALGGITGKLMAELMAGRTPSVDLAPFRPDRF